MIPLAAKIPYLWIFSRNCKWPFVEKYYLDLEILDNKLEKLDYMIL